MTDSIVSAVFLLANLGILALNLKLYTEYFKNESQRGRSR